MNRKTVIFISLGILSAALLCLIAGLICYFCHGGNPFVILIGIFMMAVGAFMAIVPIIMLIIVLISVLITKDKKTKD